MKFNFNELFLKAINEILDTRDTKLKEHIKLNCVPIDDWSRHENLESKIYDVQNIIEQSEIEYRDFSKYVERYEVCEIDANELEEKFFITSSDLQDAFENSSFEYRINELENLTFSQKQNDDNSNEIEVLKERLLTLEKQEFAQEILKRVLTLENDNQESKERILTLENFILKTLKGFK